MPLFARPYVSDATQLIDRMKANKPSLEAEQRAGRALLWDKQINLEQQAQQEAARVAQTPYVYQTK